MTDSMDTRLREMVMRLSAMAPEAPALPAAEASTAANRPVSRRRPAVVLAAAVSGVLLVVGLPLLLLGGTPDRGPATTVTPTTLPQTTVTTLPRATVPPTSVTPTSPPIPGAVYEVDNLATPSRTLTGETVVNAGYGSASDQLGLLEPQGFGPCCFDVAADGTIVIADTQNLRLTVWPVDEPPYVLHEFEASDFVPDSVAVAAGRAFVVGLTNRPGRPYDVMTIDLLTGAVVERQETDLTINVGLRTEAGRVYARAAGVVAFWVPIADVTGALVPTAEATRLDFLPMADRAVAARFSQNAPQAIVRITRLGDASTEYRFAGFVDEIYPLPDAPDSILTATIQVLGCDQPGELWLATTSVAEDAVSHQTWSLPIRSCADMGPFNTYRVAAGGVYVMSTTDTGVQIVRYPLPDAATLPPVILPTEWQPGTTTCAQLQGNVPVGIDDFGFPAPGLIEYRTNDGTIVSIQFADDPTCTADSDAWRFLILQPFTSLLGGADQEPCQMYLALGTAEQGPQNLNTVLEVAAGACGDG